MEEVLVYAVIQQSAKRELEAFERDMTRGKTAKEVFDEHWKITFYCEMQGYIANQLEEDFDDDELEILVGMTDILYQAYETFLGKDHLSINSYADDKEIIEDLIEELKEARRND